MDNLSLAPSRALPGRGFLGLSLRSDRQAVREMLVGILKKEVDRIGTVSNLFSALVAGTFLDGGAGEVLAGEIDDCPSLIVDVDELTEWLRLEYRMDLEGARQRTVKALANHEYAS